MCDKALDNYPHALKFVPDCYMTQKMFDKATNTHPPTIKFVPKCYKTQEIVIKLLMDVFFVLIGIKLNKWVTK